MKKQLDMNICMSADTPECAAPIAFALKEGGI